MSLHRSLFTILTVSTAVSLQAMVSLAPASLASSGECGSLPCGSGGGSHVQDPDIPAMPLLTYFEQV